MMRLHLPQFPLGRRRAASALVMSPVEASSSAPSAQATGPRTRREELEEELLRAEQALDAATNALRRNGSRVAFADRREAECAHVMRLRFELQALSRTGDRTSQSGRA